MDDFGNTFETDEWYMSESQYGYSMATFGFFDDVMTWMCLAYCIDYAAQEV